jgi:lipopolysaccharide biosynthesis glycosyltransferase
MKPLAFFTIADNNNLPYAKMMTNSLKKFHPDAEVIVVGEEQIKAYNDPMFFYRATPIIASELLEQYETVVKLDADQIITGDLSHIWEGKFDVACVNNSNPREYKAYPYTVWNIHPLAYLNAGFVVMKSKKFVDHWKQLCMSDHFNYYQMKEQDLLNIMVWYMNYIYDIKLLDSSDKWHGLISKGYWPQIELRETLLVLPKNEEWPVDSDKQIVCLHWAGGNSPDKMNYRTRFKPEVVKYLDKLVK